MRILIAEEVHSVHNGLRLLLEHQPGFEIMDVAVDARELFSLIEGNCPDIVLIGWELPELAGVTLLPALRRICPNLAIIVLSGRPEARQAALAAGADAFVSKGSPPEQLLASILSTSPAINKD